MSNEAICKNCKKKYENFPLSDGYCSECGDNIANDKELRYAFLNKQRDKANEEAEEADKRYEDRSVRGRI